MNCPNCGANGSFGDNFCARCGASKRSRLPVRREPSPPPALWQAAAPVVVRGAALVLAGVLSEWLLRSATKRALRVPLGSRKPARSRALAKRDDGAGAPEGAVSISETVVMRRVVLRRLGKLGAGDR
jgi:hypothetical protein